MIDQELIKKIVEEYVVGTSMFVVDVAVRPGNIIVVEVDSDNPIGIDDCIVLSKYIESKLDREQDDFELEVGSSGLSSPFRIPRQYQKNIGNEVEVLTKKGQKLSGILKSVDDNGFVVTTRKMVKLEGAKRKTEVEEDFPFNYDEIKYTKYLIRFK